MSARDFRRGAPIRLIRLGRAGPRRSQAVYHALAESMTPESPDTVILTQPDAPYLCLGYHQPFDTVLDRAECTRRGLPVLRRRVGGGATYLDANQFFYQFVFHHSRLPANFAACYAHLLAGPVATLHRLGLPGALVDVNEVESNGRRIAGIGGGRIGEAAVVVGNFLFDFDFDAMAAVWQVPWPSFRRLAREAMDECITTFRRAGCSAGPQEVEALLVEELKAALGRSLVEGGLSADEESHAGRVGERLASPDFLACQDEAHRGPMRRLKISSRGQIQADETELASRRVRGSFYLRDGLIAAAALQSEPAGEWNAAEAALRGLPLPDWQASLARMFTHRGAEATAVNLP